MDFDFDEIFLNSFLLGFSIQEMAFDTFLFNYLQSERKFLKVFHRMKDIALPLHAPGMNIIICYKSYGC